MGDNKNANETATPTSGSEDAAPQAPPADLPPPAPEEIVTPEIVDKIIKGYNPDCDLVDFIAKLGTKTGDNYMSIMYAVEINLINRKTKEASKLDVMLKTMPLNAMRQQMINDSGAFIKEANIYNEIIPKMVAFQEEKGLKEDEKVTAWPNCYITHNDGTTDYLGMQNLRTLGYKMANRHAGLDPTHATMVLQNMARYHALSFAMFRGDRSQIMTSYPWLEEKMFPSLDKVQEPMKLWFKSMFSHEADIVRKEGHSAAGDMVEAAVNDAFWPTMSDMLNGGGKFAKNAVINHGDCWTNNMLFRYDVNNRLENLKFVDFQLARCAPRSIDLNYFLHSSIPIPELNGREEEYMRIYHDEFIRFVTRLGVTPEDFDLTWEDFKEEYESCKFYGVIMGLMLAPILSAEAEDVPDMETLKEEDMTESGASEFMNQLMMGSKSASTKKIVNLALNHLPRCQQVKEEK